MSDNKIFGGKPMYFHEPTYDLDILCRQNLHIHTQFSSCAKREMNLHDIVMTAQLNSLEMIAVTDHVSPFKEDEEAFRQNLRILREIAKAINSPVKLLIGAELSAYGTENFSYAEDGIELDYRLWAQNHYHSGGWIQPEDKSPVGYKNHIMQTLTNLIESGRADCIAHPFHDSYLTNCGRLVTFEKTSVPNCFTDNEIGQMLELGKKHETAFEINLNAMVDYPDFCRRMYNLGREIGSQFNIGTDAHTLDRIDTRQFIERTKKILL